MTDIQFVDSDEHQTVTVSASTSDMRHWAANDIVDVTHEFGHMLGAMDEYFSIDYGEDRQPTGQICEQPDIDPAARNYDVVRDAVRGLLARIAER